MKHIRTLPLAESSPTCQISRPGRPSNGTTGARGTASVAALACVAALGLAALATPSSAATTAAVTTASSFTYSAADDSYVSAKYSTANYGSSTVLASGSAAGDGKVIYLKFIVHSLPAGSTNISGSLVLNRIASQYLPPTVGASVVPSTSWSEQSVTYANRPARGASLGVLQTTTGTGRATWPVAVSGNSAVAVALTSSTAATAIYNSAEGAPERPIFKVTYTPPATVTPPPSGTVWIGATCNAPTATIAVFTRATRPSAR